MKNIIQSKPTELLQGRTQESYNFVAKSDLSGKNILDIGCGYGWFELLALKQGAKKIIGTEITDTDLDTARTHIKYNRVDFVVASAIDLPFADASFDTVASWEVIEHIPEGTEGLMFAEVHRVLKQNGVFYLSSPFDSVPSTILDPAW